MRDSAPNSLKKDMLNLAGSASVGMELIETGTSEPKTNMKGDVNLSNVPITQKGLRIKVACKPITLLAGTKCKGNLPRHADYATRTVTMLVARKAKKEEVRIACTRE